MSKDKFTDFEFLGTKGNALKVSSWSKLFLGFLIGLLALSGAQHVFQIISPRTPMGGLENFTSSPQVANPIVKEVY